VDAAVEKTIGTWERLPFSRCIHAFRGGMEVPDALWEDALRPAYIASHLGHVKNTTFDQHCRRIFTKVAKKVFCDASPVFIERCLNDDFLDNVCGMMSTNNLTLNLEHPLAIIYRKLKDQDVDCIRFLKGLDQAGKLPVAQGTSLLPVFAMMNHSCQPNISIINQFDAQGVSTPCAGVTIRARRAISAGEEVCTCYIPGNVEAMPTEERQEELQIYMFECNCPLCAQPS